MQICSLNLYPVKALAGINLTRAQLTSQGLALPLREGLVHDRQWMLINAQQQMVTQRQLPELACVQPQFLHGELYLTAPGIEPIAITAAPADGPRLNSQVWKTPLHVQTCSDAVTQWLAQVLPDAGLRLVSLAGPRPMLTERFGGQSATHFADAAPFLVANTASLAALNQALQQEGDSSVDERRFRANIWFNGLEAFNEHKIAALNLAQGVIRLVDHCQRCSVITVDPDRGVFCANAKPFKTLARLNAMPNQPKAPAFGVNAVFEQSDTPWLAIGDMWF
ncbi:MAG TPA: MOSC N-terminal beta barrel domain-containing protein [Cellvibrionaceae bacterium]